MTTLKSIFFYTDDAHKPAKQHDTLEKSTESTLGDKASKEKYHLGTESVEIDSEKTRKDMLLHSQHRSNQPSVDDASYRVVSDDARARLGEVKHSSVMLKTLRLMLSKNLQSEFTATNGKAETTIAHAEDKKISQSRDVPHQVLDNAVTDAIDKDRLLLLDVVINKEKSGTWPLMEHNGALYATRDAFESWRVPLLHDIPSIKFKGLDYWPLASIPGYQSKVDIGNQSLELMFSPQAFAETQLGQKQRMKPAVNPALPTVFFNYDVNYTRNYLRSAPNVQDLSVLSEIGYSSNLGVLTNSTLVKNLTNDSTLGTDRQLLRLETTYVREYADKNTSLKIGDTMTRSGMQGQGVYFGGVQFGTNYSLTPGFAYQASPVLKGASTTTSTVELYVNDVLRQVSNVPTGPFSIDNMSTLSGSGEARLVVRDLLGRETVVTQSFVTSDKLLATGLDDWSVEAGSVRRYLGTYSSDYGAAFARGFWRRGVSNQLTLEGQAEVTANQRLVGLNGVSVLPMQWLGSAGVSLSHEDSLSNGNKWLLGLEKEWMQTSLFMQATGASASFRQLGQDTNSKPIKFQFAANLAHSSQGFGSFGLGFATVSQFDEPRINTMTASYSMRVGEQGALDFNASQSTGGVSGRYLGLLLTLPLTKDRVVNTSVTSSGGQNDFNVSMMQSPTPESQLGWRVEAGQQQNHAREQASAFYLGQYGNLTGDISATPDQTALRLSASGGLVMADYHLFATKRMNQSFALASVPGYKNVGVGLGNNVVTKTDASGVALIPNLVPYQSNFVRLESSDLPVSAEIDSIEQIAVPAFRSVVKVDFPVRSGRGALLKIQLENGDDAPAGAIVQIKGDTKEFYVARRGESYVTGLQERNDLSLDWNGKQCKFDVKLPAGTEEEILRLGPFLCKGDIK